jgi:hypothetical protein
LCFAFASNEPFNNQQFLLIVSDHCWIVSGGVANSFYEIPLSPTELLPCWLLSRPHF